MKPSAGASASVAPGTQVTAHFQPIQQLLVGEPGKTPLDDILRSIAAIEQHLGTLRTGGWRRRPDGPLVQLCITRPSGAL